MPVGRSKLLVPPLQGPAPPYGQVPPQYGQQPRTQEYQRTATIRNQVNLKKQTLRVDPAPGNDQELVISFTFDASAACR